MLEKKRTKTVNTEFLQKYHTYLLSPFAPIHVNTDGYIVKQATAEDEERLIRFLNEEGKKKDFFPVIKKISQFTDLNVSDFYLLLKDDEIVSAGALWNQTAYRQYMVKNYKGVLKVGRVFNPLLKKIGYMQFPPQNKEIDYVMLSFLLSKDDNKEYLKGLLKNILKVAKNKHELIVIGTVEQSPLNEVMKEIRNVHFDSQIYGVEFMFENHKNTSINQENLYLECGLL